MQCGPSLKAELATGWPLGPVMWFLEEGGGRAGTSLRGRGRWALLQAGPRPGPPRPAPPRALRAQPRPGAGPRLLGAVGCGRQMSSVLSLRFCYGPCVDITVSGGRVRRWPCLRRGRGCLWPQSRQPGPSDTSGEKPRAPRVAQWTLQSSGGVGEA